MSKPLHDEMNNALSNLQKERERIEQASVQMKNARISSTSKDKMVAVTVDAQGRLKDLKLSGSRYRQLAPNELTARIIETIQTAQDLAVKEAKSAFIDLLPPGLSKAMDGGFDLSAVFDSAGDFPGGPLFADDAPVAEEKDSRS